MSILLDRKYYKYTYAAWTRPNLTTDVAIGGDSFAVAADTVWSGYPIYQAVDGNDSTRWLAAKNTQSSFIVYNPLPLKVTKLVVTKQHTDSGVYASAGDVYGSHDNSNWQKLGSFSGGTYNNGFSCDLSSNNKAYKYYKITPTATASAGWGISELQITAMQQTGSVESSESSYDYYEDIKIKDFGDYGVYYGSTPIEKIYNGSQLVYEWQPYNPNTVFYNNGNIGAVTWSATLHKGIYSLSLAGGGGGASSGYYYWPAGNRGAVLVCEFKLEQPSLISVSIGAGTSGLGGRGGDTVFSINGVAAVTCPGNGGTITIDNSVINILSTTTNNTGGGGGGSGSNPTPLSPWGDGGHTNSAAGRGGGMKLEWLRLK